MEIGGTVPPFFCIIKPTHCVGWNKLLDKIKIAFQLSGRWGIGKGLWDGFYRYAPE